MKWGIFMGVCMSMGMWEKEERFGARIFLA